MENLVGINSSKQVVTSSLKVAEVFEKQHKDVIKIIKSRTAQNCALLNHIMEDTYVASNGKKNPIYYLDRDAFSFIVMGFTGKKAAEWKWKYIEAFNTMEKQLNTPFGGAMPKTLPEALRAYADALEQKEQVKKQLEIAQPKADYFDELVAQGLLTNFRVTATQLHIHQSDLMSILQNRKWIYKSGKTNLPYADKVEKGYFRVKDFCSKNGFTGRQTYVTPEGKMAIKKLLQEIFGNLLTE